MLQDIRYAIRGFFRSPGVAITVIGTIGLALGLNTTMFTVFNAFVLRPFTVRDPYSLYEFRWNTKSAGDLRMTLQEFEGFRAKNPAFSDAFAYEIVFASVTGQTMVGQRVSANYFALLGLDAAMGRPFAPEDAEDAVMVLNYSVWKTRFGADTGILGKKIPMFGRLY